MMGEVNDFQFKVILQCEQEEFNPTRKQYCEYLVEMNGVERPLKDILKENIGQQITIEQLEKDNAILTERLRECGMSEDIHKWTRGRYVLMFDEHTFFVFDNENEERMTALETTKKLNEQQATISYLNKRITELLQYIKKLHRIDDKNE